MKKISQISFKDTFLVRHPVLREGKPIESCLFDGDDLPITKHFGCFENEILVGVVSVFKNSNPIFNSENQFQIRGMAVLKEFQKFGFGKSLVFECEKYVSNQNGTLIWFNAREIAVPFYEKIGYKKVGLPFEIGDIGLHFIMNKKIELHK